MSLADILDGVFRLYRQNFVTFVGIVALLQVPVMVLQILLTLALGRGVTADILSFAEVMASFNPQVDSWTDLPISNFITFFGASMLLSLIQGIVVQQLITGALANAVARSYLDKPVSILSAYSFGAGRMVALVVAGILVGLIIFLLYLIPLGLFFGILAVLAPFSSGEGAGAIALLAVLFVLGFIGIFFLVVLIGLGFMFVTQAIVLEGRNPFDALARSWRLVLGSFWRVLGTVVILYILVWIVQGVPLYIVSAGIGFIFNDPVNDFAIQQSLSTLVAYLSLILMLPLQLTAFTLLYYDLRIRKEGFDLEMQAEALRDEAWNVR